MHDVPYGYCRCGCGQKAPLAKKTDRSTDRVAGRPMRFVSGHNGRRSDAERLAAFEAMIAFEPMTGCWLWTGAQVRGYGQLRGEDGRGWLAHRWFYVQEHGPIPDDRPLDHLCETPACVNPDHLEVVTTAINTRRGRVARLTVDRVAEIRGLLRLEWSCGDIALLYGVSKECIAGIASGRSWRDLA